LEKRIREAQKDILTDEDEPIEGKKPQISNDAGASGAGVMTKKERKAQKK